MAKGYLYDNGDELISREDVNEVPDGSTSSAGDVLSLDSNKKPKWTTPESGLPDTTGASAGDVLSLDEDKDPVWSTPSGGGGDRIYADLSVDGSAISFANEPHGEAITLEDVHDAIKNGATIFTVFGATDMRLINYQGTDLVAGDMTFLSAAGGGSWKLTLFIDVAFPASENTSLDTSDLDAPVEWTSDSVGN